MLHRLSWLKISISLLLIILFFLIVNGFFTENNKLLKEQIFWQEKASSFEELYNQAQAENERLRMELSSLGEGLFVTTVKLESANFVPSDGSNLSYSLSIEVKNTTRQRHEAANGFILFSLVKQRARSISDLVWRWFTLPGLEAGESKTIRISGKISAPPKEEMYIFANILGEPGLAKTRVVLPEKPVSPPLPKKETSKEGAGQEVPKKETPKEEPKQEAPKKEAPKESPKEETVKEEAKGRTEKEHVTEEVTRSAPVSPPVSDLPDPDPNSAADQEETEGSNTDAGFGSSEDTLHQ